MDGVQVVDAIALDGQIQKANPAAYVQVIAVSVPVLCVAAALLASYYFAKSASLEFDASSRYLGLADAVCAAGEDIDKLERLSAIFVPKTGSLLSGDQFSLNDLKPVAEFAKMLRP